MYVVTFEIPSADQFEQFMNVVKHYGFLRFMTSSQKVDRAAGQGEPAYKTPDVFTRKNPFI